MSKSVEDPTGTILLSDKPEDAAKKIIRAETDSKGSINFDFNSQPGISNLLLMLALLSKTDLDNIKSQWIGKSNYGELKSAVASQIDKFLTTFQNTYSGISEDQILEKLNHDESIINGIASKKLQRVHEAVGLRKGA